MNPAIIVLPVGIIAAVGVVHGVRANTPHLHTLTAFSNTTLTTREHTATIAEIGQRAGTVTMVLREGNTLHTVRISATTLHAADGSSLSASSVRNGDTLSLSSPTVRDLSQHWTTMHGIVVAMGASTSEPLIVQVRPSYSVVADVSPNTRYTDPSGQTNAVDEIEDADVMSLSGTYDTRLGEMTQVGAMTRLGPYRHAGKH